jgi:hypothetical protein
MDPYSADLFVLGPPASACTVSPPHPPYLSYAEALKKSTCDYSSAPCPATRREMPHPAFSTTSSITSSSCSGHSFCGSHKMKCCHKCQKMGHIRKECPFSHTFSFSLLCLFSWWLLTYLMAYRPLSLSITLLNHHLFRLISYYVQHISFISHLRNVWVLSHSCLISEKSLVLLRVMISFQCYVFVPLKSCLISVPSYLCKDPTQI